MLTTIAMLAGLALLGFLAWSWWQSRLPGRYDVMSYGVVDDGGAQPIAHSHFGVDSLTGPKGKPDYKVTLTAEKAPVRLASGQEVNAWTFNGKRARPGAPRSPRRPRPGHARQQGHRRRRDHPLARPRRPECRGRRRRRHAKRGRARRPLRLPLPAGAGRDVLVPHAPGRLAGREAGALRRAGHRPEGAPSRRRPRAPGAHVLGSHGDRSPRRRLAQSSATGHARPPAADQHRQRVGEVPALRDAPVRGRDRRRRHRTGSGSGGRADRDRSGRPLRHRVPHARRCRIRGGRKLQSRARAQSRWNRKPGRDSVRAGVRPRRAE